MPARSWLRFAGVPAVLVAGLLLQKSLGAGVARDVDRGEYFFRRDCAVCHSIGQGDGIAPDLLGVTRRREHAWLVRMIQRPAQLLNQQDPIAVALLMKYKVRMPS